MVSPCQGVNLIDSALGLGIRDTFTIPSRLLPNAEAGEDVREQVVGGPLARDLLKRRRCLLEVRQDELFRDRMPGAGQRLDGATERGIALAKEIGMTHVAHERLIAKAFAGAEH